jgi:hypothetical protein
LRFLQYGHCRIALALELSATIFCDPVFMVAFLDKLHRFIERVKERVDVPPSVGELFGHVAHFVSSAPNATRASDMQPRKDAATA